VNDMKRIQGGDMSTSPQMDNEIIDLASVLSSLRRGVAWIILVTLVMVGIGGFYAYGIAIPKFRSTAVVMLNSREEQIVDLGNVMSGLGADSSVVNTEVEVLKSRSLLVKTVDTLNLTADVEFNKSLEPEALASRAKNWVKIYLLNAPIKEELSESQIREATITSLHSALVIRNIPDSLDFQVTVESTSARKSKLIADTLVDLYILNQLEVKFEATEQATTWLTDRVTDLQIGLEEAESNLKDFRASTPLISPEALEGLEVQVKDTRDRISDMEAAQVAMREKLLRLEQASTPEQKVEAASDVQLQRMLVRLDEPGVMQSFEIRFSQLVSRVEVDISRNVSQVSALQSSLSELERQSEQQSRDLITLQQLTREAEASRLLYEYFLSRLKETSAQQGVQQADSRIISSAVEPVQPSAPRKSLILAMSAILGLFLGASLVLVRESRNRAFRTAEQLEKLTGYPAIGQIPVIKGSQRKDAITYLKTRPSSAAAEAVRNLRTSIMLSNVDVPPQVIMTCSALPGEGKTTVAMALTLNFSSMGKKVLLIEGDIRRRVFGRYLSSSQTDGIVSVLTGSRSFEEVVVHDDFVNADVLLGDEGQANAADIFSSARFSEMLKELRKVYDIIIIDTPPVLVVPDARVIAQQVDATVFVIKWDQTQREQAVGALRELESVGRPVSGVVLNQISPRGMKRYGYGNNYGPYSSYGSKYYLN